MSGLEELEGSADTSDPTGYQIPGWWNRLGQQRGEGCHQAQAGQVGDEHDAVDIAALGGDAAGEIASPPGKCRTEGIICPGTA